MTIKELTENYSRNIEQMDQPTGELTVNKEYVDSKIDSWYATIENAMNKAIPKKNYITLPHPLTSDHLKLLTWRYRNILDIKEHLGWTPLLRTQYKQLQEEMKEESKTLATNHWNKLMEETEIEYNNPKKFWKKVKRLEGSNSKETPYILNTNNKKISDDQVKEEDF